MYFNIGSVPEINVSPSLINGNVFVGEKLNIKNIIISIKKIPKKITINNLII